MTYRELTEDFEKKLDAFLAEGRDSDGGYAEVTDEDEVELCELWFALLKLKFQPDVDGDMPLEAIFVNRHKHQRMHFVPMPYPRHTKGELPLVVQNLRTATLNLSIAQGQVDILVGYLEYLSTATEDINL